MGRSRWCSTRRRTGCTRRRRRWRSYWARRASRVGFWNTIRDSLERFQAASVVDILTIAVLIYLALLLLKGTTAMSLLRGITMVIVGAAILASVLNLTVLDWLLRNSFPALLIAIPLIFHAGSRRFPGRGG